VVVVVVVVVEEGDFSILPSFAVQHF